MNSDRLGILTRKKLFELLRRSGEGELHRVSAQAP